MYHVNGIQLHRSGFIRPNRNSEKGHGRRVALRMGNHRRDDALLGKIPRRLSAILAGLMLAAGTIAYSTVPAEAAGLQYFNYATQQCLAIYSGTNDAITYSCNGHADQQWNIVPDSATGGTELVNGNGKCLATNDGATAGGTQVIQWSCNNHPDQDWSFADAAPGYPSGSYGQVYNVGASAAQHENMCLAVYAGTTNVIIWPCNGHGDQEWWLGG
jgi:hypothetical protein